MSQSNDSELADILNRDCYCISVNRTSLGDSLTAHLKESGLPERLLDKSSHLFADSPVFMQRGHLRNMEQLIRAVETVTRNAAYRSKVLATAPASARRDLGPSGVFFGYDFHLGAAGPQLIEINTNAGGVLLSLYLAAAQQDCCEAVTDFFGKQRNFDDAEQDIVAMFRAEWRSQRRSSALRTIAIVDHQPSSQFLHPEFLLFRALFERHGMEAIIADPSELEIRNGKLCAGNREVDLVYNRLTDFYLEQPANARLLEAYQLNIAVVTPSPFHYALYADKRNLALLSDRRQLLELGVSNNDIEILEKSLPRTLVVGEDNADQLWADRKQLFFKPSVGYGSRGAYRGAKITTRVWQDIVSGNYVAQAMIPPSERQLFVDGKRQSLKLDIRCVSYRGEVQQLIARLYSGQTTNLRTAGGGLATVYPTP
ncbi:MAG: hypothetical protein OEY72_01255 [Gammaproteobacteria bacterium]|nr:hypothetical protein [Gammaproteobacteria bacterium]